MGTLMAAPLDTAISYSGRLEQAGQPASGVYDLVFALFGTNVTGTALAAPITNTAVTLSNGQFSVLLDFGHEVFDGRALWLEIGVRTNGSGVFTLLTPRQVLRPVPYAHFALNARLQGDYTNAVSFTQTNNVFSGIGSNLTTLDASAIAFGTLRDSVLPTNAALLNRSTNRFSGRVIVGNDFVVTSNIVCRGNINAIGDPALGFGTVIAANLHATNSVFSGGDINVFGQIIAASNVIASGEVSAGKFNGDGSGLTNVAMTQQMVLFATNGNFLVPEGVTSLIIELWGGGGGGGNNRQNDLPEGLSSGGGGGGGGGYAKACLQVTPGSNYWVTVGAGGAPALDGGTSSFAGLVWATGGKAGEGSDAYAIIEPYGVRNPQGGAGGNGSVLTSFKGRRGRNANLSATGGGDGGDAGWGGGGGIVEVANSAGDGPEGDGPGGGGAGAGMGDGNPGSFVWGGAGAGGAVLITYVKLRP
jgi:hypothetical protein